MNCRAICFDLDDTLWDTRTVLNAAEEAFHTHLRNEYPEIAQEMPTVFRERMFSLMKERPDKAHDYTFLRQTVLTKSAECAGLCPITVLSTAMPAFLKVRSTPTLYPHVISTLQALSNMGIELGVITNGNCNLDYIPHLQSFFTFCISAEEAGSPKPHEAPFKLAGQSWKNGEEYPPENIVHVGDDLHSDIKGAKAMGWKTVWITPENTEKQVEADAMVSHVGNLLDVITKWNSK